MERHFKIPTGRHPLKRSRQNDPFAKCQPLLTTSFCSMHYFKSDHRVTEVNLELNNTDFALLKLITLWPLSAVTECPNCQQKKQMLTLKRALLPRKNSHLSGDRLITLDLFPSWNRQSFISIRIQG